MHNSIVLKEPIKPDPIKRQMIPDIAGILRKAGLPVLNVSYGVDDLVEHFTVRMRTGRTYEIIVTDDRALAAAVKVLQAVQNQ